MKGSYLPCSKDPELKCAVHRFNMGSRVCRCEMVVIEEPETRPGWKQFRRQPVKEIIPTFAEFEQYAR